MDRLGFVPSVGVRGIGRSVSGAVRVGGLKYASVGRRCRTIVRERMRPDPSDDRRGTKSADDGGAGAVMTLVGLASLFFQWLRSPNGQLFLFGFSVYLVFTGNIVAVFNAFFLFVAAAAVLPVVGLLAFRVFVSRNLVEGNCLNCGTKLAAIKNQQFTCSNCGVKLKTEEDGTFTIADPASATLDVSFREE